MSKMQARMGGKLESGDMVRERCFEEPAVWDFAVK